ncbi:TonB-dependent receptor [Pseudopedobacter saltans DSM 12145]|uniref:TonB-dependent receptor n=1 Tax=Pseudopedobacter saltans (strain ATCC 51119 / DSM 12145 / JCM 21818 / CCUG 39354 / LMG 10337 / NBRC 100064 / NCIMB 13643) TaxID=762903 RepID=F0SDF9_PSESL|nr:TonB-dependent receptor [Pseudopedobacter saltans]ADY53942.1 TonB-dependent receptor [Pseudopedobacter saltans DSM 12145]
MKAKLLMLSLLSLITVKLVAQTATVTGVVTDGDTKDFLIGATVAVKGTTKGTITNANGGYTLFAPAGKQTIQFSFIGYQTQEFVVDLKANEVKKIDLVLNPNGRQLNEVVVSAQVKGQTAAIKKQLNATGIINAVSEEKLRELPDVNVADAVGRLPGLMIQRDGGEGQKIIIRGLDPKYNTIAINGMNAPSTSSTDRSTDLNMISPEMIAGAEVMKASTADKDADGLGGTVNLILKDASSGFKLNVSGESGYHSQIDGIGRYKGNIFASNRFLNDRLGVIFTASADKTDRSNDTFRGNYDVSGNAPTEGLNYTMPWLRTTRLQSNLEKRERYNANINMDWNLGNGSKIKMSNLFSRMNRDRDVREKRYDFNGNYLRFNQTDIEFNTTNITNMLQGEFNLLNSTLEVGAGRSNSNSKTPYSHDLQFRINSPFTVPISSLLYLPPYLAVSPQFVDETPLSKYYMYEGYFNTEAAKETEYSAWLDWKKPFTVNDLISGYIKFGGKYRQKDRSLVTSQYYGRMDLREGLNVINANMPDLEKSTFKNLIGIQNFIDTGFKPHTYLNDKYDDLNFNFALDHNAMRNFYNVNRSIYQSTPSSTLQNDYDGHEEMLAEYIMSEINFGKLVTFIPGVRHDHSYLRYQAYSGQNVPESETSHFEADFEKTSDSEKFGYWLPQMHLRVKPIQWMDVRLAYTKTLSRPDYNLLAPRTIIKPTSSDVTWSRTNLKPALSTNYDLILSFYRPDWGLFTVGGFYKNIKNFIYTRSAYLLNGTVTDPTNFDGLYPELAGFNINYPLNSPNDATIKGLEFDLQIQFRKLDNFLRGVVLSTNLSFMDSKMDYFETLKGRIANPDYVQGGTEKPFLPVNSEVTYTDKLLNQPSLLFNVSLGYDYKKFSGRVSCNYQDGVLISEQHRPDAADVESTRAFTKWDAQLKYTLSKKLSLYGTLSNFTMSSDRKRRNVTDYPTSTEFYGSAAYLGFRYDIFR